MLPLFALFFPFPSFFLPFHNLSNSNSMNMKSDGDNDDTNKGLKGMPKGDSNSVASNSVADELLTPHSRPSDMRVALENLLEDLQYPSKWTNRIEYTHIKQLVYKENLIASSEGSKCALNDMLDDTTLDDSPLDDSPLDDTEYQDFFNVCSNILTSRVSSLLNTPTPMSTTSSSTLLHTMCRDLHQDFLLRRTLLLKRLDVTIKAFSWAPALGDGGEDFKVRMKKLRDDLDTPVQPVNPEDVKDFTLEEVRGGWG